MYDLCGNLGQLKKKIVRKARLWKVCICLSSNWSNFSSISEFYLHDQVGKMVTLRDFVVGFCGFKIECSRSMADASGDTAQMLLFAIKIPFLFTPPPKKKKKHFLTCFKGGGGKKQNAPTSYRFIASLWRPLFWFLRIFMTSWLIRSSRWYCRE